MTPRQAEAQALRDSGMTVAQVADAMGIGLRRAGALLAKARDNAVDAAMQAVNTDLVPHSMWTKVPPRDGEPGYSVYHKLPEEAPEALAERIREVLEGMTPAPVIAPPEQVLADLCSVYPVMDAHIGMMAWGRETGDLDYDLDLAGQDMRHAIQKVLAITPASDTGILILGGDTLHANDNANETPRSKHKLDVDGRHFKVLDVAIGIIADLVCQLAQKHRRVIVRVMRGNHDPESHMVLTFSLAERYRENPRIEVQKNPRDLFMFQWGRSAIFAHHGDKGKPQQMALYLSDVCPFWSETRHRHYLTGHVHQDQARDLGPLRWESLRAFCPPDAYAASMGYSGRRAMQSMTFDKTDGLVLRAFDPIDREPAEFQRRKA